MSYPSHFTRSLYWKTLQPNSCIHVFFKTAKILMCTHVKCRPCFYVNFSSSLFILRLKFIFKGTTDLVCVIINTPFCCLLRSVKLAVFAISDVQPFFNVNIFFIVLKSNVYDVRLEPYVYQMSVTRYGSHKSYKHLQNGNTKSLQLKYVANILLFSFFFNLHLFFAGIFTTKLT